MYCVIGHDDEYRVARRLALRKTRLGRREYWKVHPRDTLVWTDHHIET